MKTILITGGAGFIGSHLCKELLNKGNNIICVDNFITGNRDNINELESNNSFKVIEHDIIEPLYLDEDIDEIYNLGCPASPIHYQDNSIRTIKVNTIGMINILGLAKAKNSKILQASTSEVYGDAQVHPQPEEYRGNVSTTGPRACYDEGKRCAEALCFDYYRKHDLKIKVVRIFNTYGPNMSEDDRRVVPNFILQALSDKDITIYGDGEQTRSFCYIDDMISGLMKMMESNKDVTGPINLGNIDEFTINELADSVIKITDSKSNKKFLDLPQDDPKVRRPDITKAKEILKWKPEIKLEEGLIKTINYYNKYI